jgi:hypothetical protein
MSLRPVPPESGEIHVAIETPRGLAHSSIRGTRIISSMGCAKRGCPSSLHTISETHGSTQTFSESTNAASGRLRLPRLPTNVPHCFARPSHNRLG